MQDIYSFKPKKNLFLINVPSFFLLFFLKYRLITLENSSPLNFLLALLVSIITLIAFSSIYYFYTIININSEGIFEKKLFQKKGKLKFNFQHFQSAQVINDTERNIKYLEIKTDGDKYTINLNSYDENKLLLKLSEYIVISE